MDIVDTEKVSLNIEGVVPPLANKDKLEKIKAFSFLGLDEGRRFLFKYTAKTHEEADMVFNNIIEILSEKLN